MCWRGRLFGLGLMECKQSPSSLTPSSPFLSPVPPPPRVGNSERPLPLFRQHRQLLLEEEEGEPVGILQRRRQKRRKPLGEIIPHRCRPPPSGVISGEDVMHATHACNVDDDKDGNWHHVRSARPPRPSSRPPPPSLLNGMEWGVTETPTTVAADRGRQGDGA